MRGELALSGDAFMAEAKLDGLKSAAHELVDALPENSTWDDLMYRIYVRQAIEAGLKEVEEGKLIDHEEVERRLGLADG